MGVRGEEMCVSGEGMGLRGEEMRVRGDGDNELYKG